LNPAVTQWAIRNRVSAQALAELSAIFTPSLPALVDPQTAPQSEAAVQSLVRLEAVKSGARLWRNNVGALLDDRDVPVRYGLANDTKRLNETVKSGDLIGWRAVIVTPRHVGSTIAQFISRECKRPGWQFSGTDHERAQLRWAELVTADGGDAAFCTGVGSL
jgi:hypothetical protein